MKTSRLCVGSLLILHTFFCFSARAQGTAFTYQGQLYSAGNLANGSYDLKLTLYDAVTNGNIVAGPLTNAAVAVSNGLFATVIDFAAAFDGNPYWLRIQVRTNGANIFTTLLPRQPLTPTPYAIFANTASNLSGTVSFSQMPPGVVTNNAMALTLTGSFSGNGAGMTNVNAATLNGLAPGNFWQIGGNTISAGQYLGSANNQPVEFWADNQRALRLEPNPVRGAPNVIGGTMLNYVSGAAFGATIGGGGATNFAGNSYSNTVTANFGTIGGGYGNAVAGLGATVGGGYLNTASNQYSAVSAGVGNLASSNYAYVGGGQQNTANGLAATVAGGQGNLASSTNAMVGGGNYNLATAWATVGGGQSNSASGIFATVAGGYVNSASAPAATIAGGNVNTASGVSSTVGGGYGNSAHGQNATVAGGQSNDAVDEASVGGGSLNSADGLYATVAGGQQNSASANAVVAGGNNNDAYGSGSAVGGGGNNAANGADSAIGGGTGNYTDYNALVAVVAGGNNNKAYGPRSTVGGGDGNIAQGDSATVPGGFGNLALGNGSFAAGGFTKAAHDSSFVWSDGSYVGGTGYFETTAPRQFLIWASGGVGINLNNPTGDALSIGGTLRLNNNKIYFRGAPDQNHGVGYVGQGTSFGGASPDGPVLFGFGGGALGTEQNGTEHVALQWTTTSVTVNGTFNNNSDRHSKENFAPVSAAQVLEKVSRLPVSEWSYKADAATRHIGPMAQDFYSAFNVGTDDKHIAPIDEGGVALAAIKGLNEKLEAENAELKARLEKLEQLMAAKTGGVK